MKTPSPQYVIDQHGNRIAAIVPIDEYNRLIEALGEPDAQESAASQGSGSTVENAQDQEAYTEEEEQILKNRLKALGYL